ncbi:PhoH family protein [Rheinheimera sp. 4Y26]|uniref:PhoH family protein n=1 Tax=Rheinheimera sp. 4Y26 TaxID=2977811 RepID=UPI0021B13187|nr:PhoH family protein [Rheinheimera sp. 4Y26]MCT6700243.1 PhoH family protein [Rheinheimera sp. 4Y26]
MDNPVSSIEFTLEPTDHQRLSLLCGPFDDHIRQIERHFRVQLSLRDDKFRLLGLTAQLPLVQQLLQNLYQETINDSGKLVPLTAEQVHLAISGVEHPATLVQVDEQAQEVSIKTKKGLIKGRNPNQSRYVANILRHDVTFGIGPAGTGKTYLAVACAVDALEKNQVRRIVLTRPAVEAGEKLGFLPGDLAQKVDPYLRPLYDALFDMLGFEKVEKYLERGTIEIAPLAYMRGRTLSDAFIILDESQNTTVEQMKMFLTRIGFNSKAVITGDVTQVDLPRGTYSGLKHAIDVLSKVDALSFNYFVAKDVVRHPVVQKIVLAYEAFEAEAAAKKQAEREAEQAARLAASAITAPVATPAIAAEPPAAKTRSRTKKATPKSDTTAS